MGSQTYAVLEYGLCVTTDDIKEYSLKNNFNTFDVLTETGRYIGSDSEGECYLITSDWDEILDIKGGFAIFMLDKYPELFNRAYENKDAAIAELKSNYSEYLPPDFDYEGRFVRYVGTMYG